MGYISATFIGKKYSIPEDVLLYTELLEFTEDIKKQLLNAFIRKVNCELQEGNTGCLDDKDLSFDIEQQVSRFIAKLCDNGIFSRTINDYLRKNKGSFFRFSKNSQYHLKMHLPIFPGFL